MNSPVTVIPYLSFRGNCEEALTAYTQAFGGEILYLSRWTEETCKGAPSRIGKVMHAEFTIGQTRMSAGDNPESAPPNETVKFMIHTSSLKEAEDAVSILSNDGKIVTPELNGSILPGITRDSVLTICRDWGLPVEERKISVDELIEAQKRGKLEEVFGSGTAAVISPVGKLRYKDDVMTIGDGNIGEISQKLYDTVTGIQLGKLEDKFGWRVEVE